MTDFGFGIIVFFCICFIFIIASRIYEEYLFHNRDELAYKEGYDDLYPYKQLRNKVISKKMKSRAKNIMDKAFSIQEDCYRTIEMRKYGDSVVKKAYKEALEPMKKWFDEDEINIYENGSLYELGKLYSKIFG